MAEQQPLAEKPDNSAYMAPLTKTANSPNIGVNQTIEYGGNYESCD
jgi:hypothetical protein